MNDVIEFLKTVIESENDKFQGVFKGYKYKARRNVNIFYSDYDNKSYAYIYWCGYVYHKNILDEDILYNLDVHGGITYNENGVIGFDCSHNGCDLFSNLAEFKTSYATYKTKAFVKNEIRKLINQLIKLEKKEYAIYPS